MPSSLATRRRRRHGVAVGLLLGPWLVAACALVDLAEVTRLSDAGDETLVEAGGDARVDGAHDAGYDGPFAVNVSVGADHACALLVDGAVWCWGGNGQDELGHVGPESSVPIQVDGLAATALTGGGSGTTSLNGAFECALLDGGGAKCWGADGVGQLGNGTSLGADLPGNVLAVEGGTGTLSGVLAISAGAAHACAVFTGMTNAVCWGSNSDGQLGNARVGDAGVGDASTQPVPVASTASQPTAISAGARHSCAVDGDGRVACWGANTAGQLGYSTDGSSLPALVDEIGADGGLPQAQTVVAHYEHSCALLLSDNVWCWGEQSALGAGGHGGGRVPVEVVLRNMKPLEMVTAVSGGACSHTCALRYDAGPVCWGRNDQGQLGNGSTAIGNFATPVHFPPSVVVKAIATGGSDLTGQLSSCAVLADGSVWCWGSNGSGQLGDGTHDASSVPVMVKLP